MSLNFYQETLIPLKAFNCCGDDAAHSFAIQSFNSLLSSIPPDLIASETCNFNSSPSPCRYRSYNCQCMLISVDVYGPTAITRSIQ